MLRTVTALVALGASLHGCSCSGGDDPDGGGRVRRDGQPPGYDDGGGSSDFDGAGACGEISAIIRDMEASHPDFEDEIPGVVTGLVMSTVDDERKPIFAHGARTGAIDSVDSFRQWYRDTPGVNMRFEIGLPLTEESPGRFVYDDSSFFPLDGMGFGNSGMGADGAQHNFHFTTEIHTAFVYEGGEVFTFRGDDDVWLFVDGRLALDIGGVHGAAMQTVDMDAQGLTPGTQYRMDIFHAERHTSESNFRLETTIRCFVDPGPI